MGKGDKPLKGMATRPAQPGASCKTRKPPSRRGPPTVGVGGGRRVAEKAIELATRYHQGGGGRGGGGAQSPGNKLHGQEAILGEGATRKGGRRRVAEEAIKLATRCHLPR